MRFIKVEIDNKEHTLMDYCHEYGLDCLVIPLGDTEKIKQLQNTPDFLDKVLSKYLPLKKYYRFVDIYHALRGWGPSEYHCNNPEAYGEAKFVISHFNSDTEGYKNALKYIQMLDGTYVDTPQEAEIKRVNRANRKWEEKKKIFKAVLMDRNGSCCMDCKKQKTSNLLCTINTRNILNDESIAMENALIICHACNNKRKKNKK